MISIVDSGSGIPEEIQDKIFQPFFTTKRVGEGPGIGLSVSRSILNSFGGELELDPKAENTTFKLKLRKNS